MTVLAARKWADNGEMIADVARLGYLPGTVLDVTYGEGTFWKSWQPERLVACDLNPEKSPLGRSVDFTALPSADGLFDAVVMDPPYQLNGTQEDPDFAERYGVAESVSWQERHRLIKAGMGECVRVLKFGGFFLLKCQDQVCSGAVRWQTDEFTTHGRALGLVKVDRFDFLGYRPQPSMRRVCAACKHRWLKKDVACSKCAGTEMVWVPIVQEHAHGRPSTLLVFRRDLITATTTH